MKNTTNNTTQAAIENNGLLVENSIIEKAQLGDNVRLMVTANLITLTKTEMTAMEMVRTIDALVCLADSLTRVLAQSCGECDECDHCDNLDFEGIKLPEEVLELAGIPTDAKLSAFVEEANGVVHIEQAEYDYDIADVPAHLLTMLASNGVCLGELDALLIENEVL